MKKQQRQKIQYKYRYIDIFKYWKMNKPPLLHASGSLIESWCVQNMTTSKTIKCTSEAACTKIIKLALAELNDEPEPLKHVTLERKAGQLLGW